METNERWTIDTAMAHLQSLIDANERLTKERFVSQQQAVSAALAAAKEAVQKAESAAERRFESVNEFRNTLSDQQRTLMPRAEFESMEKAISFRLDAIDKQLEAQRAERTGVKGGWALAVGVVGFVLTIVTMLALAARAFSTGTP
jgi:hypothetical protein